MVKKKAAEVMALNRDTVLMHMRYLDSAVLALELVPLEESGESSRPIFDGSRLCYHPLGVVRRFKNSPEASLHDYLHSLFHGILLHGYLGTYATYAGDPLWDLACDLAVESLLESLELPMLRGEWSALARQQLAILRNAMDQGPAGAEGIFRLLGAPIGPLRDLLEARERGDLAWTQRDEHRFVRTPAEDALPMNLWKRIAERMQAELRSKSGKGGGELRLEADLARSLRQRISYEEILRKFTVSAEELRLSPDEFDYVYYCHGLSLYGDMPLLEPLEYCEENRIRDFVIVLDTSASCSRELVGRFLEETYRIIQKGQYFGDRFCLHILACDQEVRSDTVVTNHRELEEYIRTGRLTGRGGTDFRPAFTYTGQLRAQGELPRLRGLLYFTDGFGIYPEEMPDYPVLFVFPPDGSDGIQVPSWAMQAELSEKR